MKTVLRIVAVLVLLAAAAAGWAGYEAWTFLKTPPATPGQEAFFDVEPGANVRRVADKLEERGLITDARKFLLLARYKKPGRRPKNSPQIRRTAACRPVALPSIRAGCRNRCWIPWSTASRCCSASPCPKA